MEKYIKKLKLVNNEEKVLSELIDGDNKKFKHLIFFNTHSYIESLKNNLFMRSLIKSEHVFADGIGVFFASILFDKIKSKRITGYDFFEFLLNKLNYKNTRKKLFLLVENSQI